MFQFCCQLFLTVLQSHTQYLGYTRICLPGSRILNDSRDLAVTTVSGRLVYGSVIRIGNNFFLRFSLALCVNNFRECPLFPVLCNISLFKKDLVQIRHNCCVDFYHVSF